MTALTLFLALLLAGSAAHKALSRDRMVAAAARLTGLYRQGQLVLIAAGCLELAAATALLIPVLRPTGALIAAGVWLGYALALLRLRGQTLDCGCDLVAREKPVGRAQILRPAALSLLALILSLLPADPSFALDAPFAAAAMLALYLGASELLAIPHPRWRNS
ncbi:MAG: hypothetical protein B7X90_02550 [Novosphingobium sp. 17-62-19]|uniref:MauE/DoxX family redox-associated membrane protein n=1 Tax=Novosphingobium sp. 17-62-19 TaxID=1970406 RepID=UPI000BDCBB61|nr:MauE/DoxX family redox-associated membrane protein [Novosphingobium sp. 17-62-19]OYY10070.1 MAG: hypothetical protein B7Y70_09090 [Rhizobiales bacterium 35-68-8]OZA21274.1 MAG: hypothetical protein B7X90_02550 [Novosphingobium sp. 17-62-19]HQS96152.1 MauE/DoxX family redox-associated membrane protein [Novosphingobium sp.]